MVNKLIVRIILLFLLAQLIGILVLSQYIDFQKTAQTGITATTSNYVVPPPQVADESYSFISIIIAIIVGTALVLLLIKLNAMLIWRLWFMASITLALTYALYPLSRWLIPSTAIAMGVTIIVAIIIAYLKIFRVNYIAHTIGELFIYGGLAALFVPILNLTSAIILLVLLAAYDYYMVNQSGHMITLAKASMKSQLISGLYVGKPGSGANANESDEPQQAQTASKSAKTSRAVVNKNADKENKSNSDNLNSEDGTSTGVMVGGGDIAFPLFFAGALMKHSGALGSGLLVAICATGGLLVLFAISKKGKFYPAIPFVAAGCFVALGITLLF